MKMEHAWQFKPWQNRLTAMRKIIGLHPSGIRILRCRSKYSKLIGFRPSDENLYWMLARFWTSSVFIGKMKTHAKWPLKIFCYFICFHLRAEKLLLHFQHYVIFTDMFQHFGVSIKVDDTFRSSAVLAI